MIRGWFVVWLFSDLWYWKGCFMFSIGGVGVGVIVVCIRGCSVFVILCDVVDSIGVNGLEWVVIDNMVIVVEKLGWLYG